MKGQFTKIKVVLPQGTMQCIMPSPPIALREQKEGAVIRSQWPRRLNRKDLLQKLALLTKNAASPLRLCQEEDKEANALIFLSFFPGLLPVLCADPSWSQAIR